MYKVKQADTTAIRQNKHYQGETIEKKVNKIVNNKEPIKDGAPLVYTDRKEGIKAELNPRTDRWELALDAMDKVSKDKIAKRMERQTERDKKLGAEAKEGMNKEAGAPAGGADKN